MIYKEYIMENIKMNRNTTIFTSKKLHNTLRHSWIELNDAEIFGSRFYWLVKNYTKSLKS